MTDLRYPIGQFSPPATHTPASRAAGIDAIAAGPAQLRAVVAGLDEDQLDTPYRPDGWTVRQVAHHVPDSHLNAYVRVKLALSEDVPTIRPYNEAEWAKMADTQSVPIEVSLHLLDAVTRRWVAILRSLSGESFSREYIHPETGRHTLDYLVALYAWHGAHHIAQVSALRQRMGW